MSSVLGEIVLGEFTLGELSTSGSVGTPIDAGEVSDSLANYLDDTQISLAVFLEQSVSDDINSWLDATSNFLVVNLTLSKSDTLSLSDAASSDLKNGASAEDSFTLTDSVEYLLGYIVNPIDIFRLSDRATLAFQVLRSATDSLSLSDILSLIYSFQLGVADTLELTDSTLTYLSVEGVSSVGDSLNSWSDAISVRCSDETDDYYRRYLNDRTFMNGDQIQSPVDGFEMFDSVEVEVL